MEEPHDMEEDNDKEEDLEEEGAVDEEEGDKIPLSARNVNDLLTHDDSLNVGSSQIYKNQEGDNNPFSVPVNFNKHYEYRGVDLRHLNWVEYGCLMKVVKKRKEMRTTMVTTLV